MEKTDVEQHPGIERLARHIAIFAKISELYAEHSDYYSCEWVPSNEEITELIKSARKLLPHITYREIREVWRAWSAFSGNRVALLLNEPETVK